MFSLKLQTGQTCIYGISSSSFLQARSSCTQPLASSARAPFQITDGGGHSFVGTLLGPRRPLRMRVSDPGRATLVSTPLLEEVESQTSSCCSTLMTETMRCAPSAWTAQRPELSPCLAGITFTPTASGNGYESVPGALFAQSASTQTTRRPYPSIRQTVQTKTWHHLGAAHCTCEEISNRPGSRLGLLTNAQNRHILRLCRILLHGTASMALKISR
jgi:hypothetical protein